jgi:hypothetical protein
MWLLLWFMMVTEIPNFIRNMGAPSCIDCVHFIDNAGSLTYAKCKLFGMKERVSGEIIYDYACVCRDKKCSDACGSDGKYFKAKSDNSTK